MPEQLLEDSGLTALAKFVVTDGSLDDTLLRMAELACQMIPADMAGITLLAEGRPATGVFTDPQASELDTAQYSHDGPGQESFRRQEVYRIDSIYTERRWPEFTAVAAVLQAGISPPRHRSRWLTSRLTGMPASAPSGYSRLCAPAPPLSMRSAS